MGFYILNPEFNGNYQMHECVNKLIIWDVLNSFLYRQPDPNKQGVLAKQMKDAAEQDV